VGNEMKKLKRSRILLFVNTRLKEPPAQSKEKSQISFFFRAEIPCHGLEGQSGSGVADSGSLSLEVTDDGALNPTQSRYSHLSNSVY